MERFNNLLCVVEPQDSSKAAITRAVSLAQSHQAKLTVISTLAKPESLAPFITNKGEAAQALADCIENKRSALQAFVEQHCGSLEVATDILVGIPFIEIIKDVLKNDRDLVVKCSNEQDWLERLFGSDDMHLLRKCPCPVLMLKPDTGATCRRILATVDVSGGNKAAPQEAVEQEQLNQRVLTLASTFALADSAELHIGTVWSAFGEDFLRYSAFSKWPKDKVDQYVEHTLGVINDNLKAQISDMRDHIGEEAFSYLHPQLHLVKGLPAKEIPLMAQQQAIDMIVMGTVARTGVPGLIMGNTAETILEQVNCSVLVIKPPGFQCPVLIDAEDVMA